MKKQREFYQKLGMEVPGDIKGELCNMKTHLDSQRNGTSQLSLKTIGGTIHLGSQWKWNSVPVTLFDYNIGGKMCFNCHVTIQKEPSFCLFAQYSALLYRSKAAGKEECLKASLASKQAYYFSLFGRKQALTFCLLALPVQFIYLRQNLVLFIFQGCAQW